MSSTSHAIHSNSGGVLSPVVARVSPIRDYFTLIKPEVTFLVLIATALGCAMASSRLNWLVLFHTLLGTGMVAGGTATLNHYLERAFDRRMRRTLNRPLPAGRLSPEAVLHFGVGLSVLGVLYLAILVNYLTSWIGLTTLLTYLLIYTPLKRRTSLCTLIGAFPGAAPALMGWTGARNSLSLEAWALYAILFIWQFPHFLAIAWMYREDYARAGMLMLPSNDLRGNAAFRQILTASLVLIPISLIPSLLGMTGGLYSISAFLLGFGFFFFAFQASQHRTGTRAKHLLHASVFYLPLLYAVMMMNKLR
jgi:protoheme IX farnesyltransferase